jgi:catechol 2,3-dioxygenase-like lactoylglutathione lyase family enzyme
VDWKLELIVVPVSDVDRAKAFYVEQLGFALEVDYRPNEHFRVVQMTPQGSACSIAIGVGLGSSEPGSLKGLHLIVSDIEQARAELVAKQVAVSDYFHFGEAGKADGLHPERAAYGTFLSLDDPDGNAWLVQEVDRRKAA